MSSSPDLNDRLRAGADLDVTAHLLPAEARAKANGAAEASAWEPGPPPAFDDAPEPERDEHGQRLYIVPRHASPAGLAAEVAAERAAGERGTSSAEVIESWRAEGPLVHEPTGIAALDAVTGGGPVYGTRWALLGAPDAGKTALMVAIGHRYAERGIFVGFVAVDEEPGDLVTRLAQRIGYSRTDCEVREVDRLRHLADELAKLPIRFYDASHTIESAAADLHAWATASTPEGKPVRCFLGIDSVQTVRCVAARRMEDSGREVSPRAVVTANVWAIRQVASAYRMIALFTSEMARAGYRDKGAADAVNDLSVGKESGAIEYVARVVLSLRNVKGETGLLELTPVKNKHGRSDEPVYLQIDRARMTLTDSGAPEHDDLEGARMGKELARVAEDAARVAVHLARAPGHGTVAIRSAMKASHAIGHARVDVALAGLGAALVERKGSRTARLLYLDGSKLDGKVLALVPLEDRPAVVGSRPPVLEEMGVAS